MLFVLSPAERGKPSGGVEETLSRNYLASKEVSDVRVYGGI